MWELLQDQIVRPIETSSQLEGFQVQQPSSLWSWDTSPSPHVGAITNLEALQILSFWISVEVPSCRHNWLNHWPLAISLISSSRPFPKGQDWGWKCQPPNPIVGPREPAVYNKKKCFCHQETARNLVRSSLSRTKGRDQMLFFITL